MSMTKYATQVKAAKEQSKTRISNEALTALVTDSIINTQISLETLAKELDAINRHITVNPEEFNGATNDYDEIAKHLVDKLHWPNDAIRVLPQGSASTQTLIRTPNTSKFDIDAVCQVDISRIEAQDPMNFFEQIGEALDTWEPTAKKRCWRIEFSGRTYYIEFTPSIPLETVPLQVATTIRYKPSNRYSETALAVVDTPTRQWKTSNPAGFTNWVSDQAKRPVLVSRFLEKKAALSMESVDPVPEQEVPLSDTLRIAIRLLKRHRDMSVRRGFFDAEVKPISVIIVTLLTQCYEGMADLGDRYDHPIELLTDLAELMPLMIEIRDGQYWVTNPTVEGENFAERWNEDQTRKEAFDEWCALLIEDLKNVLAATDERELRARIRTVFGYHGASVSPSPSGSGLASKAPDRVYTPTATRGLA